jgi:hypothetical protein
MAGADDFGQLAGVLNLLLEAIDINVVIAQAVHLSKLHFQSPWQKSGQVYAGEVEKSSRQELEIIKDGWSSGVLLL